MSRFTSILFLTLFTGIQKVWTTKNSAHFELLFETWPNETEAIVNDTVKFVWKYYVKGKDVNVKWGSSSISSGQSVPKFDRVFFTATHYETRRKVVQSKDMPERYHGRVKIIDQATLQIVNVTLEDAGSYLCEVEDVDEGWLTLSRFATLHVLIPPKIESHPKEVIIKKVGDQLKIGCKASGTPTPVVKWYKNGRELTEDHGSSEYIKRNVSSLDAGNYICEAENNASRVHYTVQVIVHYKPFRTKIKTDARSDTVEEGGNLKIVCETQSSPDSSFTFYHYKSDQAPPMKLNYDSTNTGEIYIKNITSSHRGYYTCIPQNTVGRGVAAKIFVTVKYSPQIPSLYQKVVNLTKKDPLKIACDAEGFPKPSIKWFKGELGSKILGTGEVFRKARVDETDAGLYICEASNGIPPKAKKEVRVHIFYKPVIDTKKSGVKVPAKIGDKIELKCIANANPPPSFEWKKGNSDRLSFKSIYTINYVRKKDLGIYVCEVSNSKGVTTHKIEVFEIQQPVVEHLRLKNVAAKSVHLSWKLSGNKLFPIKRQVISYGTVNKQEEPIVIKGGKQQTYKLVNLVPYTKYEVKVKAFNEYISSDEKMATFKTNTTTPGQPGRPKIEVTTRTTVNVSWPTPKEPNGEIVAYLLEYSLINNTHWKKEMIRENVNFKLLMGLKNEETYKFKVRAFTKAGKGPFSRTTEFRIGIPEEIDPSKPRDLQVRETSKHVYLLEWRKQLQDFGKTVKVAINLKWKIKHSGKTGEERRVIDIGKQRRSRSIVLFDWVAVMKQTSPTRQLEFRYLFPNTEYSVSVKEGMRVKNGIRWSGTSADIGIETSAGVPSQPIDIAVRISKDNSYRLVWKRPLYSGGQLEKYIIFHRKSNERWTAKDLTDDIKNESLSVIVDVKDTSVHYHFKVQAKGNKPGLFSHVIELVQESDLLLPEFVSDSPESVKITWTKPDSPWDKITMYTIYYREGEKGSWKLKDISSGLQNNTLHVKIKGLESSTKYLVKLQAISSRFVILSKEYSVTSVSASARGNGDTDYAPLFGGIVAGVLIFAFVIIVVAMYIRYNYRKRQRHIRRRHSSGHATPGVLITQQNGHTHISSPSDHLSSDSPGSEKYLRPEKKGNSVQVPMQVLGGGTKPIPVAKLQEYYDKNRRDGNRGLSQEFKTLNTPTDYSYDECKKDVNKSKNRYANIVTYDHSRVCLSHLGDAGSDYINANYVDGYNCSEKFIATQGPVLTTFNDFWRMIWEQNCSAIVMVTNLIEKGKVKCQKYWPVTEAELYGAITVHPIEEWELTDYTIRKFQMQQNNNAGLVRDVTQFHYTGWPDHGVPVYPTRFLAFVRRLKNYYTVTGGKIVVHCSTGVGRTGTFIALDSLLDQMRNEDAVGIHGFVSLMRTQRNAMVQTEAQYSFIYEAILEASVCGQTEIAVPDFKEKFREMCRTSEEQENLLFKEFENLRNLSVEEKETFVSALAQENKRKNRFNSILPYDTNRVKLWPYPNEKWSDYINASFIDGYRNREIFIATQAPLKQTQEDFWRMVWEYECYVLVMLCNLVENQEIQCSQYWPSEGEEYLIFGLLMIEMETVEEHGSFIKRKLKCTNTKSGEVRSIHHLEYTTWTENKVPIGSNSFLDFIKEILKLEQQTGNGLTLVHCSDGSSRVGILITTYIALERLKLECLIDVFSIVRNLRTERVGMIENLEQYRFCYQILQDYLQSPKNPAITIN